MRPRAGFGLGHLHELPREIRTHASEFITATQRQPPITCAVEMDAIIAGQVKHAVEGRWHAHMHTAARGRARHAISHLRLLCRTARSPRLSQESLHGQLVSESLWRDCPCRCVVPRTRAQRARRVGAVVCGMGMGCSVHRFRPPSHRTTIAPMRAFREISQRNRKS